VGPFCVLIAPFVLFRPERPGTRSVPFPEERHQENRTRKTCSLCHSDRGILFDPNTGLSVVSFAHFFYGDGPLVHPPIFGKGREISSDPPLFFPSISSPRYAQISALCTLLYWPASSP